MVTADSVRQESPAFDSSMLVNRDPENAQIFREKSTTATTDFVGPLAI